ncbi:hypothetical protein J2X36_002722 [Methylobacterium sp. BE186]|uniref:hypothetical protein n=1 Tax=Methylobacterium sp. BE186 TaxID=2817715 RepID=UPI00285C6369|nr:hypothetical protein [Methylobacterium sp. BE186]MDR7037967.1 hypothetical protein [Methylobacterium sp. BE186]
MLASKRIAAALGCRRHALIRAFAKIAVPSRRASARALRASALASLATQAAYSLLRRRRCTWRMQATKVVSFAVCERHRLPSLSSLIFGIARFLDRTEP